MGVHGVSTVDTLLSCSATGSDHLSLCVYPVTCRCQWSERHEGLSDCFMAILLRTLAQVCGG